MRKGIGTKLRIGVRLASHAFAALVLAATCLAGSVPAKAQAVAIEPRFENAGHFHEGIAPAMSGGLWGFIDRKGEWLVKPTWDEVQSGSGGRFAVRSDERWGFMNTTGTIVVEPTYDEAQPFHDGVAAVRRGDRWGYIGPTGLIEIEFLYEDANPREDGFVTVSRDGTWRMIDGRGSVLEFYIQSVIDATAFAEGFAIVTVEERGVAAVHKIQPAWGEGVVLGPYQDMRRFSEGLAAFTKDGKKWGYVDQTGKVVIAPRFEKAREFGQGLAPVQLGGKWGFVDRTGAVVAEPQYDAAYSFRDGFALIRSGDKRGFVMLDGGKVKEWLPPKYEDAYGFFEGMAPVKENGLWGYVASGADAHSIREIADLHPQ